MRNEEALCRSQSSQDELLAVARALKKQFAGNRKDSSDPAQTTAGEESGSHYSKAAEIYGELRVAGKKGKDGVWHSVALKAYPVVSRYQIHLSRSRIENPLNGGDGRVRTDDRRATLTRCA